MASAAADAATSIGASSSSPALLPPKKHDVFINFRGADIRRQFLSHLRTAFSRELIDVSIDEKTPKGEQVWDDLAEAIQESHVAVVIFSENYADSKWCLRELKKILECRKTNRQIVIPVFYNVDPSTVRTQNGTYMNGLNKHINDSDVKAYELAQWKECLAQAANLAGWNSKDERSESELVQNIVQNVLQKLRKMYPRDLLEGLVGIEESYGCIKSLLENSSVEVRKIGIWGMPGIGKTTLANVVFFKISSKFEGSCFLPNVREQSERHGVDCLREKLIGKLLENADLGIGSTGTPFVMSDFDLRRLHRKRVLIVLDDVKSSEQIDCLIGPPICLGAGSRVIITSRNKNELSGCVDYIIGITTLNSQQSLELFCLKAFKEVHPRMGYERVTQSAVSFANGNPLALTVLGSMLHNKSLLEFKSMLTKLQKLPPKRIQHVLKLSYDGLDEFQRNIFLDIACFWKGVDIQDLIQMLNDLYDIEFAESEIKTLLDKALVTISYRSNEVQMHDLIQQMGTEIVRQENVENPGYRSRLWDVNDIYNVLKNNKGTDAVKSISFDVSQCRHVDLSPDVFKRMPNVKYLKFYTSAGSDTCNLNVPSDLDSFPILRFLHWVGCPLKSLPSTFSAENLVELYMPKGNMEKLWGGVQNFVNLKSINLSSCKNLATLPNLSEASKLETLDLSNCSNLVDIFSWLKYLKELRNLNLEFCGKLKCLPRNIHLPRLKKVNCRGCSSLEEFSLTSSEMLYLSLEDTAIKTLSSEIWSFNKIETLILSSCKRFENFPEFPDSYLLLSYLYLNETNIESLPVSIKYVITLRYLNLKKCERLGSVPELPPFLCFFCATDCALLEKVARSDTDLKGGRQTLYYYNCTNLDYGSRNNIIADAQQRIKKTAAEDRRGYRQPWNVSVSICLPGKDIPDWFNIQEAGSSLVFNLDSNRRASKLLGFALCLVLGEFQEQYEDYEEINVQCKLILKNSSFSISSKFEENYAQNRQGIPRDLSSDHLFIWYDVNFGCDELYGESVLLFKFYGPDDRSDLVRKCGIHPLYAEDVVSGSGPKSLDDMIVKKGLYPQFYTSSQSDSRDLNVQASLDFLPDVKFRRRFGASLQSLSTIVDREFLCWVGPPLQSLRTTVKPEFLVELHMPKGNMKILWDGVQNLVSLKLLNLSSCKSLAILPNLSQASKLETLDLSNCSNLVENFSWLKYLKELCNLNLEFCGKLKRLPRNIHLPRLEEVNCRGCSSLEEFSLISSNMVYLSLENTAIETLPREIWSFNKIETLILSSCTRFENLPEFPNHAGQQPRLQDLYLNETNIESLPASIKVLPYLRYLNLKKCKRIGSVPELPRFLRFFCATDCTLLENVASSDTGLQGDRQALCYYNCTNLNQSSRNNIIADARHRIMKIAVQSLQHDAQPWAASVSVCLPGKDIPDWFNIQIPVSCFSYRLDPGLLGFALCLVLGEFQEQSQAYEEINVQCKLKCRGVQISSSKFEEKYVEYSQDKPRGLSSDHVFIWYDVNFLPRPFVLMDGVFSFEFYGPDGKSNLVRKCGIRPLYFQDVGSGSGAEDLDDMKFHIKL